jgi:ERCC4-type nuclease
MIFGDTKERAVAKALQSLAVYAQDVAVNPSMSIDDRMKVIQWLAKKYLETNKALIRIKTEAVGKK